MNMQKKNNVIVHSEISSIFQELFKVQSLDLHVSIGDINGWDSIGHMRLIIALEERFNVRLEYSEIIELSSVELIQTFLGKKGVL